jgi:hypothetical protein
MSRLFYISALLTKHKPGTLTTRLVSGHRYVASEDEAIGSFLRAVRHDYPEYSVEDHLIGEVPGFAPTPPVNTTGEK